MTVELVPYDPEWPEMFAAAAAQLQSVEPEWLIEHIGSTAVPGLLAKPLIDLAIRRVGPRTSTAIVESLRTLAGS